MHFSDCYKLASQIPEEAARKELIQRLTSVETVLRSNNFMDFLKEVAETEESSHQRICDYFLYNPKRQYSKTSRLIDWSFKYDYMVFNKAVRLFQKEVTALKQLEEKKEKSDSDLHWMLLGISQGKYTAIENLKGNSQCKEEDKKVYSDIKSLLQNLCSSIEKKISTLEDSIEIREEHFKLIKKYASHALPLYEFNDPFTGDSSGYGLSWTDKYGELVSTKSLDRLSIVSDLEIYEKSQQKNSLVNHSGTELTIWDAFSKLNTTNIFSIAYRTKKEALSTIALRVVGRGI